MNVDTFDFDEWVSLAKSAPDVFEQRRRERVEHLISECSDIRRLRGLQCRIDMERIRARTAMKACLRMNSLMWDSFLELQTLFNTFANNSPAKKKSSMPAREAQIIYLPPKK